MNARITTLLLLLAATRMTIAQSIFTEDFESGLGRWQLRGERAISLETAFGHGRVLKLKSEGLVYALIKGSERWGPVAISGAFMFPDDADNYLGFIYHYTENKTRTDFGSIYIKGNDSYIRINPFRDGNASRLLYEEYKINLTGESTIVPGKWHRFRMEVLGRHCHLYVDDMTQPKITFSHFEGTWGQVGFQSRVAGYAVLLDNITVEKIASLSYTGKPIPEHSYAKEKLVTEWESIGPFDRCIRALDETDASMQKTVRVDRKNCEWIKFETDDRGAVVTGRLTEFEGRNNVGYFRTLIKAEEEKKVMLHISSTEELGIYVNGIFNGFHYRQGYGNKRAQDWNAWYDFHQNKEHEGGRFPVRLKKGDNYIMVRVQNGQFAAGGFFMAVE